MSTCLLCHLQGEIRATAFNTTVDTFYNSLEEGKAYVLTDAKVSPSKKQFGNVANDFEIMLEKKTQIDPVSCLPAPGSPHLHL